MLQQNNADNSSSEVKNLTAQGLLRRQCAAVICNKQNNLLNNFYV